MNVVTGTLTRILGSQVLRDVQTFVAAFDTLFGGFRQRAERDLPVVARPGDGLRGGRGAGAGRAARGGLLRGTPRPPSACRCRVLCSTG